MNGVYLFRSSLPTSNIDNVHLYIELIIMYIKNLNKRPNTDNVFIFKFDCRKMYSYNKN